MWYYHYWISLWIWCHKSSTCRKQHNGGKYITFFINLFIEEKSNEFITIFFGVIPFNDKKIYIYLLMQVCLQIISMQIRSKKGRTISFQWCMEISTQRLLKHSTAQHTWSINIKVSEFQSSKAPTTHSEYCV